MVGKCICNGHSEHCKFFKTNLIKYTKICYKKINNLCEEENNALIKVGG